ncbi:MAG: hypothetical protein ABUL67_01495, partial [Haliangium ochraceum]
CPVSERLPRFASDCIPDEQSGSRRGLQGGQKNDRREGDRADLFRIANGIAEEITAGIVLGIWNGIANQIARMHLADKVPSRPRSEAGASIAPGRMAEVTRRTADAKGSRRSSTSVPSGGPCYREGGDTNNLGNGSARRCENVSCRG